jgi:hypothetical protein
LFAPPLRDLFPAVAFPLSRSYVGKWADDLFGVFACASIPPNSGNSLRLDQRTSHLRTYPALWCGDGWRRALCPMEWRLAEHVRTMTDRRGMMPERYFTQHGFSRSAASGDARMACSAPNVSMGHPGDAAVHIHSAVTGAQPTRNAT